MGIRATSFTWVQQPGAASFRAKGVRWADDWPFHIIQDDRTHINIRVR